MAFHVLLAFLGHLSCYALCVDSAGTASSADVVPGKLSSLS